jgi:hypothetical protein
MIPGLQGAELDLETVVSPSQAQLPGLYKGHDVFFFTSRYVDGWMGGCVSGCSSVRGIVHISWALFPVVKFAVMCLDIGSAWPW